MNTLVMKKNVSTVDWHHMVLAARTVPPKNIDMAAVGINVAGVALPALGVAVVTALRKSTKNRKLSELSDNSDHLTDRPSNLKDFILSAQMSIYGIKDTPINNIKDETLDIRPYIESLSEFIALCDTPMTIAIQGDWGSGKTSMMNLIKINLEETHPNEIFSIWFNTWQYSQFNAHEQLGVSLLSRFASEVAQGQAGVDRVKQMLEIVGKSILKSAVFLGSAVAIQSLEGAKDLQESALSPFSKDIISTITELKNSIQELTKKALQNQGKKRIVVFIDDLDRLIPERAVELLEVFKLFLDIDNCVFVLACDYQVIAQGLKAKFNIGENELKGKSFFDKIIQLPFSMPINQYNTKKYTKDLLEKIQLNYGAEDELEIYQKLIQHSVGLNPRSMKRLFNAFQLISLAATKLPNETKQYSYSATERQRIILACLCLQTSFEPVYNYLIRNSEDIDNSTFEAFSNGDHTEEFPDLLVEMGGKDSLMSKNISSFMLAFKNAILFEKNINDDNDDLQLSKLINILKFSSITSSISIGQVEESSDECRQFKEVAISYCKEFNKKYKNNNKFDKLKALLIHRKGKAKGKITVSNKGFLIDQKRVVIEFIFDNRQNPTCFQVIMKHRDQDWLLSYCKERNKKSKPNDSNDAVIYTNEDIDNGDDITYATRLSKFTSFVDTFFNNELQKFHR